MFGFPETLQQHSPRLLAAVPMPRVHVPEDEGVRGRRLDPWEGRGKQRLVLTSMGVWTLSSSSQGKTASAGSTAGPLCVNVYAWVWGHVDRHIHESVHI